eukprot:NODE_31_length_37178_cov_0.413576.p28 type:complete len:128 gc:universal NODE_31_length_37178_cov_0.413576:19748-20131(+)
MYLMLLTIILAEINKNFAHLDDALREKLMKDQIITGDLPVEDENRVWFSSYDKDGNMKLDGQEIMFGIVHEDIIDENKGEFTDYSKSEYFTNEADLYEQVDHIFDQFDLNGDGYVDYNEYKKGIDGE